MTSTTGTTLQTYLAKIEEEANKRSYGKVTGIFTITNGQLTDAEIIVSDHDHFPLAKNMP